MADESAVMRQMWPLVLEATKKRRRFTWILLSQNVKGFTYDGAVLTLAWLNQGAVDNFVTSGSVSVLEEALEEVLSRPATVESVLDTTPPAPSPLTPSGPATPTRASATTANPSPQPEPEAASTVHRALGQTAFLLHERDDNQAAALLMDVVDVELARSSRLAQRMDAVLIVPSVLVPRFTDEIIAAIEPVFVHVAGRHGLQINRVRADTALPEVGADWRQVLQAKLPGATTPEQAPQLPPDEASPAPDRDKTVNVQATGCTRHGKTTGRQCRRPAAEWPAYDDLPPPVAACFSHLTPEEQKACQQARDRAREEYNARWKAELAARKARGDDLKPLTFTPRPCIGQCISQEKAGGSDSDGASMSCANCDSWVCVSCGKAQVEQVLEFCGPCSAREALFDPEPEWDGQYNGEADTDPDPRTRLTAMVNNLVEATGTTHREVNARLNRRIGVSSRVGAGEQDIRRAAGAARAWLDELGSSS
jgi:hypothetical protein